MIEKVLRGSSLWIIGSKEAGGYQPSPEGLRKVSVVRLNCGTN